MSSLRPICSTSNSGTRSTLNPDDAKDVATARADAEGHHLARDDFGVPNANEAQLRGTRPAPESTRVVQRGAVLHRSHPQLAASVPIPTQPHGSCHADVRSLEHVNQQVPIRDQRQVCVHHGRRRASL
eukprot:363948-Chlamydomonas_euryale.AAC.6